MNELSESDLKRFDQRALYWRVLAVAQIPITFFAVVVFLISFFRADTIVDVDEERPSGKYPVSELANKEFANVGLRVVNLVATYQPVTARLQFQSAREFFAESALPSFDELWVDKELATSEGSGISQVFWIDSALVQVRRPKGGGSVFVRVPGIRQRLLDQQKLSEEEAVFDFEMISGDPQEGNRYGIRIAKVEVKAKALKLIEEENKRISADEKEDPKDRKRKKRRRRRGEEPAPTEAPARPLTF